MKKINVFDDAFFAAEKHDGEPRKRWVQAEHGCGEGVCATVVVRWLKYKLIGSDNFWTVVEETGIKRRLKWNSILTKQAYYVKEAKAAKVDKTVHYGGQLAVDRLTGHRNKTAFSETKAMKFRQKFEGLTHHSTDPMSVGKVEDIMGWTTEWPGCASYVSLGAQYYKNLYGHAVGVFCNEARQVLFFDPNMGEVWFPDRGRFKTWWVKEYKPAWQKDEHYRYFNTCRITRMRGVSDLDGLKSLAGWATREVSPDPNAWLKELAGSSSGGLDLNTSTGNPLQVLPSGDLDDETQAELDALLENVDETLFQEDFNL